MSIKETNKRPIGLLTGGTSSDEVYKFQIHLSNGVKVDLPPLREPGPKIPVDEIIKQAKEEYRRVVRFTDAVKGKKRFNWESRSLVLHDANGVKIVSALSFKSFKSHKYHMLFLYDECEEKTHTFENMWDLTPDPELLKELPEDYTFETALADLIDNSLQAVWSNDRDDQRIINVDILEDRISIFDSGPGMDGSEENSIVKWGKMGASLHRSYKEQAVGGKPPYLKPFFGMFGYGGPIASMHLGRRAVVSSKTKNSKKVYFLHLEREALVRSSGSDRSWKTPGGIRDPLEEETENSPHGSFTKVEIFEPKLKKLDIRRIKCWLKDIYFPYIQCDEVSKTGKTVMPVMFQVNGTNLAGIGGGEVAITNIHSSNGPDFVLGLHFSLKQESEKSSSRSCVKANARLKCVYFPASEGKENIERILETLKDDKHKISEQYDNFSRVSIRRLGRLLPDARWAWLPFMDLRHKKGSDKFRLLKRCCFRVKCFIDTDAGMNPTPSKTDLAQQNPFTIALKNFGGNFSESEKVVDINVRRDGKALSLVQLEKEYQDWILEMHNRYDEEVDRGEDQPIIVVSPMQKKGSAIASDVGRFHKVFKRKGETWKSGQKVKLLKGAAPKIHKKNVYATLEYFYLGGFEGDTGGDHRIICRPIDIIAEEGCVLSEVDGQTSFDLRKSLSIPIGVIDSEMCVLVDNAEWKTQIEKERQKSPSSIELLCAKHCLELGFDEEELDTLVEAGKTPPMEVVAVVRPLNYAPESDPKDLDQRDILKWNSDMSLAVKFQDEKSGKVEHLHSAWVTPTQQKGIQGVYVFSLGCKLPRLFYKAGLYKFAFSLVDSSCQTLKEVTVKPSPQIKKWKIIRGIKSPPYSLRVGCTCKLLSVLCHDMYGNRTSFTSKEVRVKLQASAGVGFDVKDLKTALSVSKETLNIQKMRIECRDLDHIRPAYGATLTVASLDGLFSDSIPCVVHPGDIESVESQPPTLENQLLPGCIINELQFRMFDAFHNHALKGSFVDFKFKGFQLLDKLGSKRKVDDCGCVDLNGILKVNASYGQTVSLAVSSNDKVVFEREWLIERRELRIASKVPESLTAGSLLENIKFEVVNSEGDLDMTIHNEEKNGQSHMLTIKADWLNTEHSVRYTFVYGRCCVPAITLPQEEGRFQFQAKHSRHSILSLDVELYLVKPLSLIPEVEYGENQSSQRDPDLSQRDPDLSQRDLDLLLLQDPNPLAVVGKKFMLLTQNQENKCRDKFRVCREEIEKLKKKITRIKAHKDVVEDNIRASQDSCSLGFPNGFITREEVVEEIEKRGHSAAMTLYNISRRVPFGEPKDSLVKDVIGIVALLGRVNSFPLSRVLSEYLGEDQMLAVVTRSFEAVSSLEKYRRGGEVDSDDALHGEAIKHGNSIIGRFLVICLEDIRSIMGPCFGLENHQRKLVLPLPSLPNGTVPSGFLGHAVNMIDLDEEHFRIKTRSGLGLRETLFYRLFGNLQVYRTRSEMLSARSCINSSGGAVSLDGGILKENGVVSLGFGDPDICFQVVPAESGTSCSEDDLNELKMDFSELRKTNKVLKELTEELAREMKKYEKMQNRNEELFGTQETGETNDLY